MRIAYAALTLALAGALVVALPAPAAAQECRRTCAVAESRDANGCCVPAGGAAATAPRAAPAIRCPAGTSWNESRRVCVGRLACPAGSHPSDAGGGACVADAVGCPPGTRSEGGACVADVTCPANTERRANECVASVTCPPNSRLEGERCVSSEVTCPAGFERREGAGPCVGDPVCPRGTRFRQGVGCAGEVVCPEGSHFDGERCVPDASACLEGTRNVRGRGCVDVCEQFAHSRWVGEHRACECAEGFTARGGVCVEGCPAGMDRVEGRCVPERVCPYQWRFDAATQHCVDEAAEAAQARTLAARRREMEAERARREEELQRRWAAGPAFQLYGGAGFHYYALPGFSYARTTPPECTTERYSPRWVGFGPAAGVAFSSDTFVVGASYTRVGSATQACGAAGTYRVERGPSSLDLITGEIGIQGAGRVHAFRITFTGGLDVSGAGLVGGVTYRSLFRIWAGLFVGVEVRGSVMVNYGGRDSIGVGFENMRADDFRATSPLGYGFGGSVVAGYSIH